MLSRMAIEDVDDLVASGAKLSAQEIVRLNALGCKSQCNQDSASFFALPRAAFLGDLVFREATIGHEMWMDNVSRRFDFADGVTSFALRAFALTRDQSELPEWTNVNAVKASLSLFTNQIKKFTARQILSCLDYVTDGNDANSGEYPAVSGDADGENAEEPFSAAAGVMREGMSIGLGISIADAMKMTRSELQSVIHRAYAVKGIDVDKSMHDRAIGDYLATLAEIKRVHAEEIDHGRDETSV